MSAVRDGERTAVYGGYRQPVADVVVYDQGNRSKPHRCWACGKRLAPGDRVVRQADLGEWDYAHQRCWVP